VDGIVGVMMRLWCLVELLSLLYNQSTRSGIADVPSASWTLSWARSRSETNASLLPYLVYHFSIEHTSLRFFLCLFGGFVVSLDTRYRPHHIDCTHSKLYSQPVQSRLTWTKALTEVLATINHAQTLHKADMEDH
jgi:hypothetical protein